MSYLYNKFPSATSGKLSTARARAVSAPVLSSIAIKHLGLHKLMLVNETNLSIAMGKYIPTLEETSYEDMVLNAWAHDPPKAISDVLESLLGAVFVDSGWNWDLAQAVAEGVMNDVLELLSPDTPKDPVSELMVWTAKAGCTRICLRYVLPFLSSTFVSSVNDRSYLCLLNKCTASHAVARTRQGTTRSTLWCTMSTYLGHSLRPASVWRGLLRQRELASFSRMSSLPIHFNECAHANRP